MLEDLDKNIWLLEGYLEHPLGAEYVEWRVNTEG